MRAGNREVDMSLPAHIPLGEILPATVDLVIADDDALRATFAGKTIEICRIGIPALDPSRSLADGGVTDGELLIVTAQHVTPPIYRFDPCSAITEVASAESPSRPPSGAIALPTAVICWAGVLELCFVALSLVTGQQSQALFASLTSTASAVLAAIAFRYREATRTLSAWAAVWGSTFAMASGALAVPGDPTASHLLLAMSACSTVAFGLSRLSGCGTRVLLAISGTSGAAAVVIFGAAMSWWTLAAVGPSLVAVSLAVLAMGPRLAAMIARLAPNDAVDDGLRQRAAHAHEVLSSVVAVSAGCTALGLVLTATCGSGGMASSCLIMAGAIVLLSHMRRHRDPHRVRALALCGAIAITAFPLLVVIDDFFWAPWLFSVIAPLVFTCIWYAVGPGQLGAVGRNLVDGVEFAMAAAVPPLTCWSMGLFSAVRGMSLS